MATIVLVPGAGLGGWAWSRVTPLLERQGHAVHPVTLSGLGAHDRGADAAAIDLSTHVADLVTLLERDDLRDVVLVGHSLSGLAIAGAAGRMSQRIARLVFLDAVLPVSGVSAFEAAGPEFEQAIVAAAEAGGDARRVPWFDDATLDLYYPGNELSPEDRAWIRRESAGHPLAVFREPLEIAETTLPRTYVTCTRRMGPSPIGDATPGWAHATLDAGHWPMITRPSETAALLSEIASSAAASGATAR
ncbi:alpha/beta hydrolase [Conexibacter stalactiti]|uniref:Alpha/beta hydrolase n=1 Tax=Conexibacter stalactiti TaxID=1940611 RepID=A0ABU4HSX9_9ACTN|nr:alpha/beta hydrolase [Conexibacter stalactiti]MDW5596383.1 alpha/beta hydrolase [Conexibacter stalactiti]MEC5037025.1 alpha/beta hydrolase [Conexibacter stalactiti]